MRRDICCFYAKNTAEVFNAYAAAVKSVFGKDAELQPYNTISFGLNFSFKYNMNGGACTLRFLPYQSGTAVNVRYSIAQAVGAKYKKHCDDLTRAAERTLNCLSQPINISVDEFLSPTAAAQAATSPVQPTDAPAQPRTFKFCIHCGTKLNINDKFCISCGKTQS